MAERGPAATLQDTLCATCYKSVDRSWHTRSTVAHGFVKHGFKVIHGYTACKRTGFVKPDSVKLAKGHLLHGEAAP